MMDKGVSFLVRLKSSDYKKSRPPWPDQMNGLRSFWTRAVSSIIKEPILITSLPCNVYLKRFLLWLKIRGYITEVENESIDKSGLWIINGSAEGHSIHYDEVEQNHTVGAAVRCKSGNVYAGVNVYSLHGACAEQVAIGTAITQGGAGVWGDRCRPGQRRRGDRSALRQLPSDVEWLYAGVQRDPSDRWRGKESESKRAVAVCVWGGITKIGFIWQLRLVDLW